MPQTAAGAGNSASNKQLIQALIRSRLFRDYESVFTKATGLPLTLRPLEYWQLAHAGKKHENPFCALLAEHPATLSVCLAAHEQMIRHTGVLPHTVTCPYGLTETALPVKLGDKVIGYLRIGQVLRHMPQKSDAAKAERTVTEQGVRFTRKFRDAWEKSPLIPPEKYNAIVRLLGFFGEQLSTLINQIVLESQNIEPPLVQKARDYIGKHRMESLSLSDVAKASGASVFISARSSRKRLGRLLPTMLGGCDWKTPRRSS